MTEIRSEHACHSNIVDEAKKIALSRETISYTKEFQYKQEKMHLIRCEIQRNQFVCKIAHTISRLNCLVQTPLLLLLA